MKLIRRLGAILVLADLFVSTPRLVIAFLEVQGLGQSVLVQQYRGVLVGSTAIGTAVLLSLGTAFVAYWLTKVRTEGLARYALAASVGTGILGLFCLVYPELASYLVGVDLSGYLLSTMWRAPWLVTASALPLVQVTGIVIASSCHEDSADAVVSEKVSEASAPESSLPVLPPLPFECSDCGSSFSTERGLRAHQSRWCK